MERRQWRAHEVRLQHAGVRARLAASNTQVWLDGPRRARPTPPPRDRQGSSGHSGCPPPPAKHRVANGNGNGSWQLAGPRCCYGHARLAIATPMPPHRRRHAHQVLAGGGIALAALTTNNSLASSSSLYRSSLQQPHLSLQLEAALGSTYTLKHTRSEVAVSVVVLSLVTRQGKELEEREAHLRGWWWWCGGCQGGGGCGGGGGATGGGVLAHGGWGDGRSAPTVCHRLWPGPCGWRLAFTCQQA